MYRTIIVCACLMIGLAAGAAAEESASGADGATEAGAKMVRGMSVLGNNEAPMSLFIVPWKSSQLGTEANLGRTLDEREVAVDQEVFMRELDYYRISTNTDERGKQSLK